MKKLLITIFAHIFTIATILFSFVANLYFKIRLNKLYNQKKNLSYSQISKLLNLYRNSYKEEISSEYPNEERIHFLKGKIIEFDKKLKQIDSQTSQRFTSSDYCKSVI